MKEKNILEEIEEDLHRQEIAYIESENLGLDIERKEAVFIKKHIKAVH